MKSTLLFLLIITSVTSGQLPDGIVSNDGIENQVIFKSGTDGYNTYRIPSLLVTKNGSILAFCEGRKAGRSDAGNIDLIVKRSTDEGVTWSNHNIVWDDESNTCGNPCPVVDMQTGTIWLLMTWNLGSDHERDIIAQTSKDTRHVFVSHSKDDGQSWSKPKDITSDVKIPGWTWYATGPCTGIQMSRGSHKGRLIVPCDHIEAETKKYYSHIIYSDDNGRTWDLGGTTPTDQVNECQAVELPDGSIMLNMRNYDRDKKTRAVTISKDSGITFSKLYHDPVLIEPICQASITSIYHDNIPYLLFSNPASKSARINMTIRMSSDQGQTWPVAKTIHAGPSAYSCLAVLPSGKIGCLYEGGSKNPYENIILAVFSADWLIR